MELLIPLDSRSKKPLYEQIYSHIRAEIRNGSLKAGERLPSTRVLAEHLKVSRSTTQMAYDQLLAEGYMEARPCRGYFVSHLEDLVETGATGTGEMETTVETDAGLSVDFSPRGIDLDSFPYHVWRKLSRRNRWKRKKSRRRFWRFWRHRQKLKLRRNPRDLSRQ